MEEEWKEVIDYPGYFVSNFGNIKGTRFKNKPLKQHQSNKGYFQVGLHNENGRRTINVHRLVAKHFLEDYDENLHTDHVDRNKTNNHVSNLRMVTNQVNIRNQNKRQGTTSNHKGVWFSNKRNHWISTITIYKNIYIGQFKTEEEAALAYNKYIIDNKLEGFILNEI